MWRNEQNRKIEKQGDRDDAQEINAFWKKINNNNNYQANISKLGRGKGFKIINEMYFVYMAL